MSVPETVSRHALSEGRRWFRVAAGCYDGAGSCDVQGRQNDLGQYRLAALIRQFLSIAFLTGKPSDLPGSRDSLHFAIVLAVLTYIAATISFMGFGLAVGHAILDIILSGGALYLALHFVNKLPRFNQAFSAYCGAGSVVNLASLPIIYTSRASEAQSGFVVIEVTFWAWSISVLAHVIRFTFETNIPVSIIAALGYIVLAVTIFDLVFPG